MYQRLVISTQKDGSFMHIDQRLLDCSLFVENWPLCQLRLMNDKRYPWCLLIPCLPNAIEIHDLSSDSQNQLFKEIMDLSQHMSFLFKPDKMNIGALGNIVPQLHIHVICRFKTDSAWPNPVWNGSPAIAYRTEEAIDITSRLIKQKS